MISYIYIYIYIAQYHVSHVILMLFSSSGILVVMKIVLFKQISHIMLHRNFEFCFWVDKSKEIQSSNVFI